MCPEMDAQDSFAQNRSRWFRTHMPPETHDGTEPESVTRRRHVSWVNCRQRGIILGRRQHTVKDEQMTCIWSGGRIIKLTSSFL